MAKKQNPAFAKYQALLKKVRNANPNMPFAKAQKEAAKQFHNGVVAKVSGVKKRKKVAGPVKRKAVTTKKRISAASPKPARVGRKTAAKKTGVAKIGTITRAEKLVREINSLEAKRKKVNHKIVRDIVQLEINKKEMSLAALRRAAR